MTAPPIAHEQTAPWALPVLRRLRQSRLLQSVTALYIAHAANYLLLLLTVPYQSRVLGPAALGKVAFAQGYATLIVLMVEYGFNFSGAREAAARRESPTSLADLMAGVMGAKVLLAFVGVALAECLRRSFGWLNTDPLVAWAAFFWAVAQSFNLSWYFQGLEQMKLVGIVDVANRLIITLSIFVLIRGPQDAWRVLGLQGAAGFVTFVAGLYFAYRAIPWRWPTFTNTRSALKLGWRILVFRIAETAYTGANSFVLGLFAPNAIVGLYAGAEKITRTCYLMLEPFSRAMYIRVNHVLGHSDAGEERLLRLSTLVMGGTGFSMAALLFFGAPGIVRILLGAQYVGSVPVLRLLAILPFCIALKNVLGFHCMLPRRMDRELNTIILWSAVFHVTGVILLVPRLQQYGMAAAAALTETFIVICIYVVLRRRNCLPWSRSLQIN